MEMLIYDQASNTLFSNKIGSVQFNTVLAVTGAIDGSSPGKFYKEIEFKYLHQGR